jgi:DNA-directed RNA polymerase
MQDLMAEQVRLEEEMASLGIDKYRADFHKSLNDGKASETRSVGVAFDSALVPFTGALVKFCEEARSGRAGRRHSAYRAIKDLEPDAVAFITLKLVLDGYVRDRELTTLANRVGGYVETEARIKAYQTKQPNLVASVVRKLDGKTSHGEHRRKVLSHMLRTGDDGWTAWTTREKVTVGIKLIELLATSTGLIEIETLRLRRRPITMVSTTDRFRTWICSLNFQTEIMTPEFQPCVVPPKDWDRLDGCGYHTDAFAYPLRLVKTRSKRHLQLLAKADLTSVFKAINAIQRTPWAINTEIIAVARHLFAVGSGVAGLPSQLQPLPTKPLDIDTNEEARKRWRRMAAITYETNTSLRSKIVQTEKTLAVAEKFASYEAIYFPYQLDFRGRIYAVASCLSPQGTDLAKALLHFAEGDRIETSEAHRWFLIHGANCFGVDKVSFDERIAWTKANAERIIGAAEAPLDDLWWTEADSPFCFLAWAYEYKAYRLAAAVGLPFTSRIAVAMDGSCNGLQHYSAMLRDPVAGKAVNLVPSDRPQDIYGTVAERVMQTLANIAAQEHHPSLSMASNADEVRREADWANRWGSYSIDRKITKRPVMVLPYGGTLNSCQKYVTDAVMSRGDAPFSEEELGPALNWLSGLVWQAIGDTVISARLAMGWLRQTTAAVSKTGVPLSWTTPSGFPVFQAYSETRELRIETALFGVRFQPRIAEELPDVIDRRRQQNGVAPNFVHSMDAAALVLTVCAAVDQGVTKFAMIHDSYGTTAALSPLLASTLRQEFADMYESYDALEQFAHSVIPGGSRPGIDMPPFVGGLDLRGVLQSDYFFA